MEGYYKVNETGGTYVVATFFNPETGHEFSKCVRDYDYSDGSRDDDELYNMPIDEEARAEWQHRHGVIFEGDTVMVFKGRKVPVGTVATVVRTRSVYDRYGRYVCRYADLDNGMSTNTDNCILVM